MRKQLKEKYEVDGDILGLSNGEKQEGKFLGRPVRYTASGIEWEAGSKQVDSLLSEFSFDSGNGVDTHHDSSQMQKRE